MNIYHFLCLSLLHRSQKKRDSMYVVVSGDSKKKIRIYLVKIFVQWVAILSERLFNYFYTHKCFQRYFFGFFLIFTLLWHVSWKCLVYKMHTFSERILFQEPMTKIVHFLRIFVSICIATSQKHIFHIFTAKCCLSLMQKCNSLSKHGKPVRRKLMYSLYPRPDDYTQWVARFLLLCFFTRKIFSMFFKLHVGQIQTHIVPL